GLAGDEPCAQAVREGRARCAPRRRRGSRLRPQVASADRGERRGGPLPPGRLAGRDRAGDRRLDGVVGLTMTIVMVHGASAAGSSCSSVIRPFKAKGFKVIEAPIPLKSLSDDIRALDRVLDRTSGPVVLASHAYAGAVISATTNPRVKSLVFVAGLTPAEGETVAEVFYREKPHALAPQLAPDASGNIWMPDEGFASAFAPHASPEQIWLLKATQR